VEKGDAGAQSEHSWMVPRMQRLREAAPASSLVRMEYNISIVGTRNILQTLANSNFASLLVATALHVLLLHIIFYFSISI
jgi:hypothetical protein